MTSRRTLGDHARFGVFLQRYAHGLLDAVRDKASEIMQANRTQSMKDDGVHFQLQPRPDGRKPTVHIHVNEEADQ